VGAVRSKNTLPSLTPKNFPLLSSEKRSWEGELFFGKFKIAEFSANF
jgi:hypothetical protein